MMMVGIVIGSGIYLTTGIIAESIPSPGLILLAWLAGGLLTLAGALTYAELGAAMPEAGGQYVYLREAYGPLFGFLFGWVCFLVYLSGAVATLSVACAEYLGYFFPDLSTNRIILSKTMNILDRSFQYSLSMGQMVAVALILLLSIVNYLGVGFGKLVQNLFTVIKIGTILLFVILGLTVGERSSIDLTLNPTHLDFGQLIVGFGAALIAVSFAFDGWNNVNFVAGEIKNPGRALPRALLFGTLAITTLYLLINYVYLTTLPIAEMAGVIRIAEKTTASLFGEMGAGILSAAIIISIFGALNGAIFVNARVYYAMARDRLFFQRVGKVHPRFRTPSVALFIQAIWASILAVLGNFQQLFTYATFVAILLWVAATASVFTLRKKRPDLPRPYKSWGYPVIPAIFILASVGILLNMLIEAPFESIAGLGFTAVGIPVYYFWKRKTV